MLVKHLYLLYIRNKHQLISKVCMFSEHVLSFQQGDQVHKSVFIIFFQGDQLKNRVKKICEGWVCYLILSMPQLMD